MKTNSLRIIGGKWRGRKIAFPDIDGLRPTHDRIRETLFNWLMHETAGANCLDVFAGSGALGLEALSRGASNVTFIDNQRAICDALRHTISELETEAQVLQGAYDQLALADLNGPFDIVFLDPPFRQSLLSAAIAWLDNNALLSKNALIYIEAEKGGLPAQLPQDWECFRSKSTSTLDYYLFKHISV